MRNKKYHRNKHTHELEEEDDESENTLVTVDTIRRKESEFNGLCSEHGIYEQLIPIFPLLGILGTVAGILNQNDMNLALETTLWGLVFAIGLKALDALFPSRIINDVEVKLDDFDRKLELADKFSE